jgi:hypothetical protein
MSLPKPQSIKNKLISWTSSKLRTVSVKGGKDTVMV